MKMIDKISIYFNGYSTSSPYSISEYLKILDEYKSRSDLFTAITQLKRKG